MPRLPKAGTISHTQMIRAYVYDDKRQQRRIEEHGRLNCRTLRELTVSY
jgi:hypothetical protein